MSKASENKSPTLRPILAGGQYSRRVEGGNVRATAPEDGLILSSPEEDVFLSENSIDIALGQLAAERTEAKAAEQSAEALAVIPEVPSDKGSL